MKKLLPSLYTLIVVLIGWVAISIQEISDPTNIIHWIASILGFLLIIFPAESYWLNVFTPKEKEHCDENCGCKK